jgi:hypothetical protein
VVTVIAVVVPIALSGCAVVGVESGNAELGVSGYVIEKGPGVWVRCEGWTYVSFGEAIFVSKRNEVGFFCCSKVEEGGFAVLGEAFSIAAA